MTDGVTERARVLVACADATGVVAAVAGFLADHGANILEADQHTDPDTRQFFMRVEFETAGLRTGLDALAQDFTAIAKRFDMDARVEPARRRRVAVLCSKQTHCVADLLWRATTDELEAELAMVVSNHTDAKPFAAQLGVPFHHMPVSPDTKDAQHAAMLRLLVDSDIELVVLARYMQVVPPSFVEAFGDRIINIHHSFLPAFAGAKPYHQAFAKGVKLIGATAHYVTAELDEGPIIAQQTEPVTHRDAVADMVRSGRDLDRVVLARAVRLHLAGKVRVHAGRTIVFD